jgi:hypothetical protein
VTTGDGDLEIEPTRWAPDDIRPDRGIRRLTVYDDVRAALGERGWVQGRRAHRGRLSLTAAIDIVVGVDDNASGPTALSLARSARVRNHLCELATTANLVAWNDDRARTFDDLAVLLGMAAVAYPDD